MINNENITKTLFDTSPDMVAILDKNGKIIDCNKHLEKNTHYNKNELIGLDGPINLILNEDKEILSTAFEELKVTNIKQNVSLRMKRKNNSIFSSIWSGATLRNDSDELEGYLVTGKDISDMEQQKKNISDKQLQRQEKLALIGELSARIAHDIRNPLSIVMVSLENLKILYDADEIKQKQLNRTDDQLIELPIK